MASYTIEFVTNAYISIPVEANTREEAEALADKMLTRHSVWVETSDDLPRNTEAWIAGKDWEFNRDIDDENDA